MKAQDELLIVADREVRKIGLSNVLRSDDPEGTKLWALKQAYGAMRGGEMPDDEICVTLINIIKGV